MRKIPTTVSTSCDNSTTGRVDNVEPFSSMARNDGNLNHNKKPKRPTICLIIKFLIKILKLGVWENRKGTLSNGPIQTEVENLLRKRRKI